MRRTLLTVAAAATVAVGPGAALALAHAGSHHHHTAHVRRHTRTERFGGVAGAPEGSTGATGTTGVTGTTGATGPQLPPPQSAGVVASFNNGVLAIRLNDGSTVSGMITDSTRLDCASTTGGSVDDNGGGDDNNSNQGSGGVAGNQGAGGGWSGGGHGDDESANVSCTLAAITPGAVVGEAELRISSSGSVWESVQIVS